MEISRKSGPPGVIAHRSLGLGAVENSWEAFQRLVVANRRCSLAVEFDVRCTKDGALVIFHDEDILGYNIADLSYRELRSITRFGCPPLLEEVVPLLQGKGIPLINIELKVMTAIDRVVAMLDAWRQERVLVSSFLTEAVEYVSEVAPYFETALLLDPLLEFRPTTEARMAEFLRIGADVLNVEVSQVTEELSAAVRAQGKQLGVYTLNDPTLMVEWSRRRLVDWIITDVPAVLVPGVLSEPENQAVSA